MYRLSAHSVMRSPQCRMGEMPGSVQIINSPITRLMPEALENSIKHIVYMFVCCTITTNASTGHHGIWFIRICCGATSHV